MNARLELLNSWVTLLNIIFGGNIFCLKFLEWCSQSRAHEIIILEVEDDYDDDGEEEDEEEEHGEEVTDDEDGTGEHGEWKNDEMEQLEKEYRDLHHQELWDSI